MWMIEQTDSRLIARLKLIYLIPLALLVGPFIGIWWYLKAAYRVVEDFWFLGPVPPTQERFTELHEAWHWLNEHPAFWRYYKAKGYDDVNVLLNDDGGFFISLDIVLVKVDPITKRFEDERVRNTETAIWLEAGAAAWDSRIGSTHYHDPQLDCGGSTYEKAIVAMANQVYKYYGDYKITDDYKIELWSSDKKYAVCLEPGTRTGELCGRKFTLMARFMKPKEWENVVPWTQHKIDD